MSLADFVERYIAAHDVSEDYEEQLRSAVRGLEATDSELSAETVNAYLKALRKAGRKVFEQSYLIHDVVEQSKLPNEPLV